MKLPKAIADKLEKRIAENALRQLPEPSALVDFSSNDYLGFSRSQTIFDTTHQWLVDNGYNQNGATGSRLLSGNHAVYSIAEHDIATFHQTEDALIFNSGYDANVGFFSAIPQRGDLILFDELCHASIRDGIRMSYSKSLKFNHNDSEHLSELVAKHVAGFSTIYIVTESVFSMDGDSPNLTEMNKIAHDFGAYLVVDEAHALGVFGTNGEGLVQSLNLQDKVFARIVTFGKALGCHGAAVLGSTDLKTALVNFARSFIYTTGLSPHSVATLLQSYRHLEQNPAIGHALKEKIGQFNRISKQLSLNPIFVYSKSAIHCAIIPGNSKVKIMAQALQEKGFDVKPILAPTVPEGQERLRFCLHAYNSEQDITTVLHTLHQLLFK